MDVNNQCDCCSPEITRYFGTKLTKFHEDRKIIVAARVLTRKNSPTRVAMFLTKTIFELIQDIIGTNLLTKYHDDRKINVTSKVLIRKRALPRDIIGMNLLIEFHEDWTINVAFRVKNARPAPWQPYVIKTNLLTIVHQDWTINVASRVKNVPPPPGGHVFQPTGIIF
ncbi:hypothetical protein DPMN_095716 [Dreissena polymorpha]|uniref:Uncharacterized protein n=1 Tax=Dreissena polymorpha TaxID=45954 RepID=A0A9D4L8F2_DREPO|nr:hypothetical protein DPMN_095716 [Dreissena polymorpha]